MRRRTLEGEIVLPGKTYSPAEMVRTLLNRRWLVLVPLAAGLTLAAAVAPSQVSLASLLTAALGGLVAGLAIVALLEYRNTSFSDEEDVARVLGLPVLGAVPMLRTPPQERVHRYWRSSREVAGWLLLIGSVGLAVWRLRP
jgi:membrane protein YdbS with pleckstrin-like domain